MYYPGVPDSAALVKTYRVKYLKAISVTFHLKKNIEREIHKSPYCFDRIVYVSVILGILFWDNNSIIYFV